ncbi:MAG TPA: phage holin family protein [Verrucomicrobiae bacterium]|nr:phage holin family protein [Verrucomicrobiae bacterium]
MEATTTGRQTIMGLIRNLKDDTQALLRHELNLAKTELMEKLAMVGRNSTALAIGGFVAYAGLIVFLMGLGWLVAWAFQKAGVEPVLAGFLGLALIGFVFIAIGGAFVFKGIKAFSSESIAPQRTIHTIQRLKGPEAQIPKPEPPPAPRQSSKEIQVKVEQTEDRLSDTVEELGQRLSPRHINAKVKQRIQQKPYKAGLIAMGAGLISGFFVKRAYRRP